MSGAKSTLSALLAGATLLWCGAVEAAFPEHPVHIIIGFDPGGSSDTSARVVAKQLSEKWGQPVLVESKAGADTTIAAAYVATSKPDGYTLLWTTNAHTISPNEYKLTYDPIKSFIPVSLVVSQPNVLFINPAKMPVNSLKDLIALAKSKPGEFNFGSGGPGSPNYMSMALLMHDTGTKMVNVNYKGAGPAVVALLSGEIPMMFGSLTSGLEYVKEGKLKALAVSSGTRNAAMPDVPTVAEAGSLPDYDFSTWNGVLAPAGTPKDVLDKLHDDIAAVAKSQEGLSTFAKLGFDVTANTPAEFQKVLDHEMVMWADLLKNESKPQ